MPGIGGSELKAEGSRAEVWHGSAKHTSGGLEKKDLIMNKWGRIVSKKKHATAKRENRLHKHGWTAKKGKFGAVKMAFYKGSPSKTNKGKKDFTTKKTSKVFHRKGRYVKKSYRPYSR